MLNLMNPVGAIWRLSRQGQTGLPASEVRKLGRNSKFTDMEPRTPNSVQSRSLVIFRQHRLNLYVVLRKLISKLQAFSQSIQETSMMRFYPSIHSDDEMLIRQLSCDSAFHGSPHPIAAADRARTECHGSVPNQNSVAQFVSEVRSFWRNAVTFEVKVAEMALHYPFLPVVTKPQRVVVHLRNRPQVDS
jgi:hypothetical protein